MTVSAHDKRPLVPTLLLVAAAAGIVVFTALRFIHLGADPPRGITRSGVFYTDEGWYSRNAISRCLDGPWIVEGDFNPAVNMPVLQVLNYASFKLFGMGLAQARIAGAAAFALTLVLLALALRRRFPRGVLPVVVLLLSCNFLLFTFSRTAIAESVLVLFVAASMYFAIRSHRRRPVANAAISALCLALAVLTKLIAVFFLPVMIFFMWGFHDKEGSRSAKLFFKKLASAAAVLCVVLGGYYILAVIPNMEDFKYFNALNIAQRIKRFGDETAAMKAIYVLKGSSLRASGANFIVYVFGMMSMLVVLFARRLKRDPLMIAMLLWIFFYMAIIAVNGYAPPRYYIPVMIPLTVLMVRIAVWLPGAVKGGFLSSALGAQGKFLAPALAAGGIVLIGVVLSLNAFEIARYVQKPEYTFRDMSRRIGEIARGEADNGGGGAQAAANAMADWAAGARPALLGHFANSISLEAGIPSYNDSFRTWTIERLMTRYEPRYYVCYGAAEKVDPQDEYYEASQYLLKYHMLVHVAHFDVLGNYYRGVPVYLYRIKWQTLAPDSVPK